MPRARRTAATTIIISTALAAGMLAAAPAAHAGSLRYVASTFAMTGETTPNSIASAGGLLFVADSNSVAVYNENGAYRTTIGGVFGARAVTPAEDGSAVYVAESTSGQIAVIDPVTLTKVDDIAVKDCPISDLAVVGDVLYYGYACASSGEINHVDLLTGTAHDTDAPDITSLFSAPKLAADGGRLIALDGFGALRSWAVDAGTGAVSDLKTADAGTQTFGDIDAGHGRIAIATMSGYDFQMFNSATLSKIADLPAAAYPASVGIAPNGTIVATTNFGGTDPNTTNAFWFYDPITAATLRTTGQPGGWGSFTEIEGGVAFNAAGTIAYTLASTYDSGYYIVASTVGAPGSRSVSVTATSAKAYGYATRFTVRATPGSTATLTITPAGSSEIRVKVAVGSTGVATYSRVLTQGGTARAAVAGDLTHGGATSATVSYRAASAATVAMSKPRKQVHGVYVYAKAGNARQVMTLRPYVYGRAITVKLWRNKVGKKSWKAVQTVTLITDGYGRVFTYMKAMTRGYHYRITYAFKGDSYNTGSSGTTKVFRLR